MRAGTILRMLLMGLAATLALPLAVGVLALRAPASGARAAAGGPSVVATVAVGTRPWGVAVNSSTNRIYVANYNSNNVSVIDGASNTVVATVATGSNPEQMALNPSTNRVYVTNPGSNNLSVIDGASNTVATVAVGSSPHGVVLNPSTNRIYVTNYNSNNVSVIDGANNTIVATVSVGSNPYGAALNPSTNRIYVANQGDDTVSVIQDYLVPPSVGGISEAPDVADTNPEASASDRSRIPVPAEVAAALAASVVALGVGGWYAKRRWQR